LGRHTIGGKGISLKNKKVTIDGATAQVVSQEEIQARHLRIWLEHMRVTNRSLTESLHQQYGGDQILIHNAKLEINVVSSTLPDGHELKSWVLDQLNQKTSDSEESK
jgi:hypothetical protein